jgi:hypothetical protein
MKISSGMSQSQVGDKLFEIVQYYKNSRAENFDMDYIICCLDLHHKKTRFFLWVVGWRQAAHFCTWLASRFGTVSPKLHYFKRGHFPGLGIRAIRSKNLTCSRNFFCEKPCP